MRRRLTIRGIVQGVGFRPFVYRLAHDLSLKGWVVNTGQGVEIEVQGSSSALDAFQTALPVQAPPTARIYRMTTATVPEQSIPNDEVPSFAIRMSHAGGKRETLIPPDLATCKECLQEISNPRSRRYRYPFTTCTRCGPRYSMIHALPYDRANTTMTAFALCRQCHAEYEDMADRRFHAEAMACPACGPYLSLWDGQGAVLAEKEEALQEACRMVLRGDIVAVKGLGGFQLWVNACSETAVQQLRVRKRRPRKPFAVLFPSLEVLKASVLCSPQEEQLLLSPAAPIVLMRRTKSSSVTAAVAPGNPYIGAMVAYTPLHHLLMAELQIPVVATSGNRREEPIVIDEQEALSRLAGLADAFLVHNRPIARPVDDSVVRLVEDELLLLRRARGYAPVPIFPHQSMSHDDTPVLAVGGQLKNTIAVTSGNLVVVSQHIGELSTVETYRQLTQTVTEHLDLFEVRPKVIACDQHPDYVSTGFASHLGKGFNVPVLPVQHHYAHILSCMAEHGLREPVLGVAWDGAGYGTDGTIWGGEWLVVNEAGWTRVGHLRPFALPGGEQAMREPYRVAVSLLYEIYGETEMPWFLPTFRVMEPKLKDMLIAMLRQQLNSPLTSSMGRLFDGVSSMLGICHISSFEGEAAMALEFLADEITGQDDGSEYTIPLIREGEGPFVADWRPLVKTVVEEIACGVETAQIAFKVQQALVALLADVAGKFGIPNVVLSGGVFQNVRVLRSAQTQLAKIGCRVYTHHQVPPNDGGLSLGQAMAAAMYLQNELTPTNRERV